MLAPKWCVSKSMVAPVQSIHHSSVSAGYSSQELPFRLCPTVCFMETVILEHVSPTPAGSAHWTGSSSGGLPESHPSLTTH